MAKVIMIQGTMSNAGKSLLAAGLCRIFRQDGYRVAPFKSQNMALNSFATKEGLEMGRAQVVQAEAAGIEPMVCMNPILLKPTDDEGSQVIVNGRSIGNMKARDYFAYKTQLIPVIKDAFRKLEEMADIIVIEGAGSPAEINLKENDIVNMGLAEMVDAPVLLVGDIDRGGVFAQLLGTVMLLEENEKARIGGLIINKFRGDASLLDSGIEMLEEKGGIPVAGVVPYMDIKVEDEDSLSERLSNRRKNRTAGAGDGQQAGGYIDIAVMRLPKISNFSDMDVFEQFPDVAVRYVSRADEVGSPDLVIIPGSKSTIADLRWLRDTGLEDEIRRCCREDNTRCSERKSPILKASRAAEVSKVSGCCRSGLSWQVTRGPSSTRGDSERPKEYLQTCPALRSRDTRYTWAGQRLFPVSHPEAPELHAVMSTAHMYTAFSTEVKWLRLW